MTKNEYKKHKVRKNRLIIFADLLKESNLKYNGILEYMIGSRDLDLKYVVEY